MLGEITQITAHLSNNAMDYFKDCSQFYKRLCKRYLYLLRNTN